MTILNKEDYNQVYICPNCASSHIDFSRERSIDGEAIVRCGDCGWSHREPNRLGYSNTQLYYQGVAAYRPTKSEHVTYPNEKSERELLEDILAEMKEIKHLLLAQNTKVERILDPDDRIEEIYDKHSDLLQAGPGFKAPDIRCSAKEEESDGN